MVTVLTTPRHPRDPTGRQRSIRSHTTAMSLTGAVRLAVDVLFHFTCRATKGSALWSEAEQVWLGVETYMYWATRDEGIDIPWAVANALGAPGKADDLQCAVRQELLSYWADQMASLPRRGRPYWFPLP